ncbi:conserved hypothetical protein [Verticillium alfalfae VaMs.102]|uniref:Uncharacterized protein n=1 Tax=Verticillium alfalfae (strain VaMs.102 / ATCC MYA-4576 / FGSC 10136) TaxID=526221 RepID=C9SGZ9_VERA1|nr:conserved hypothetical protein [Verticillium alfalfae VaMs.102]EEY17593.1 conserved hypothetical protein [Verticillium alfalfae VaMs.102]
MSLSNHPKAYGSAAIVVAFSAGILVTLGFKDFYPDLERRYQRHRRAVRRRNTSSSTSKDEASRRAPSFGARPSS